MSDADRRGADSAPGVVVILRLPMTPPLELFHALRRAGVTAIEITTNTPDAFATVEAWRGLGGLRVGVGTVRTPDQVARAVDAGAEFLVSPGSNESVLAAARQAGLPLLCGAATPTEIEQAWRCGAAAVKIFPVDCLGGPAYVRAVQAPLSDIPLVPTGGVGADEAQRYAELGCAGVGVGSAAVDRAAVAAGDWPELTQRVAAIVAAWRRGTA